MGFFNKEDDVVRNVPPVRSLHYKPIPYNLEIGDRVEIRYSRPYHIQVGGVFPIKHGDDLEVTDILFSQEIFKKSGAVKYDVYVKKVGDNMTFIWKTLPDSDNLNVEYIIDF